MNAMLLLDGSTGEGGGQILRTSLALAMVTGQSFRVHSIRARRPKPGLMRQHLVAVRAAAEVCNAELSGDAIGSRELVFRPRAPKHGDYLFQIGSAGSATLVLQTVLPALLVAEGRSNLVLEGGTHNPMAPPFDFLERAFLPLLRRMGASVQAKLVSYGFYPAGGGRMEATIEGGKKLSALSLEERGAIVATRLRAIVSQIPGSIGVREVDTFLAKIPWDRKVARPEVVKNSPGPGNALVADVESEHVTEVFTGFGERGVRAEAVAEKVAAEVEHYLKAGVPVAEHLADQLLLPMALGEGGVFRTLAPSGHTKTQVEVMKTFLGSEVSLDARGPDDVRVTVKPARL
jgi:RNA 3'-terminal phosphate cyclase (ATP)